MLFAAATPIIAMLGLSQTGQTLVQTLSVSVSLWMRRDQDADTAIELFRLNYERPWLVRTSNHEPRRTNRT